MIGKVLELFSTDMSIDLGTANTIVSVKGRGIVINEPSVVAVKKDKFGVNKILAVGSEAKKMLGKTPGNVEAIRPMKDGVIADFDITEAMIRYFIQKVHARKRFVSPRVIICVPYDLTQVERKAVKEAAYNANAREVHLIEEPMAAAIGAGLPIMEPVGNLVVDIGGGTTEIGVVSLGGLVISKSLKVAGDRIDKAIVDFVKEKYNLLIGERTGEEIKIKIGSAVVVPNDELKMYVKGKDQIRGLLTKIELTSKDIKDAMEKPLKDIANALKEVLEQMPPDLAGDIVENGIVLTGGGALIRGLDVYLKNIVKLPVFVAENPLLAVAKGTGEALENIDILKLVHSDND